MTSVIVNKIGLDIVDIEVEQSGSPESDLFFQEPVLDHSKEYVVGISELSVPLGSEPMLTLNASLKEQVFLEFRKRRAANGSANPVNHASSVIASDVARFKLKDRQIQSPVDLIQNLIVFVYTFQQSIDQSATAVTANTDYNISLSASPSGILSFRGNAQFWKDYIVCIGQDDQEDTYARDILGYDQDYIGVRRLPDGTMSTQHPTEIIDGALSFALDTNPQNITGGTDVKMRYSIYRFAEHRLRIEVDADLSIPSNILVENGIQKLHYNIASFALEQTFHGKVIATANGVIRDQVSHTTNMFVGNTVVKAKDSLTSDWYTLQSAANVQNMRLHILVVRREYDVINNKWILIRNKLRMSDDTSQNWFATLKFIQCF